MVINLGKTLARYIRIYLTYLRITLQTAMQYRVSFFFELVIELGYLVWTLTFFYVVLANVTEIAGWSYYEVMVVVGIFTIFSETITGLFYVWNLRVLPEKIKDGTIDFPLLKPINSQFMLTASATYLSSFFTTIPGFLLIWYGINHLDYFTFSLVHTTFAVITFLCGVLIFYSIMVMVTSLAFFFTNAERLAHFVIDLYQFGQYPPTLYKGKVRLLFTFALPVVFVAGIPADTLLHGASAINVLSSLVVASVFFFASTIVWKRMIAYYSSASS